MVLAAVSIVVGGVLLVPGAHARLNPAVPSTATAGATGSPRPSFSVQASPSVPPPKATPGRTKPSPKSQRRTLAAGRVSVKIERGFFSYALLDRRSGKVSGANLGATSSTESMIKVWIVSDYLRRLGAEEAPSDRLAQASSAIRDSDDAAAQSLFIAGGSAAVINRLARTCRLRQTRPVVPPGADVVWWSYTEMSAKDAVRMGECVKNGTAAGPRWTEWVLGQMAEVRGTTAARDQRPTSGGGRWGIIDGLPEDILDQSPVGIKNGWTLRRDDGLWHVNCLAITDDWVLAVLLRYPGDQDLDRGAAICASVAKQLVTPYQKAG
ncbi:hypothetical protein ACIBF5_17020 [Micromonospora sp. NPDC050417]|uniref:hypothetical protein n=1 Tax=Micromonospora sp. NPDC050417 TaxID=3364280 RepID=UPI00378F96DE